MNSSILDPLSAGLKLDLRPADIADCTARRFCRISWLTGFCLRMLVRSVMCLKNR